MDLNPTEQHAVQEVLATFAAEQQMLLPLLQDVQRRLGYVPESALPLIAERLNLSRADVHGAATFYHDLRTSRAGTHHLQLCGAEACQAVGSRALEAHARDSLGIEPGQTTPDGLITVERAYCFGNCACGPTLRVGVEIHGRVTPQRFDEIVSALRSGTLSGALLTGAGP